MDGYFSDICGTSSHQTTLCPIIFPCEIRSRVMHQAYLCPFYEPKNRMSSLDFCRFCSSSMHPTCLCPYYEPKVHDNHDNGVVVATYYEPKVHDNHDNGVVVAINEQLGKAYMLRDMKNLNEDNSVMLSVSISKNELAVCKPITISFPYFVCKQVVTFLISCLLFLCRPLVNIR